MRSHVGFACAALVMGFAGGARAQDLAPPPPIDPNAPGAPNANTPKNEDGKSTTEQLDKAEKEDSGRNFELVYVNADAGFSYINMESFNATSLALEKTSSVGPGFGLGAGIRLFIFAFGARLKLNQLSAFNLWQLNGEFALHFGENKFDPYIGLHGGYSFVGTLSSSAVNPGDPSVNNPNNDVSIRGWDAGLSLGFDYYFSSLVSLGLEGSAEALFLKRPPVPIPAGVPQAVKDKISQDPLYKDSGTSAGMGASAILRLGIHFGF